AILLYDAGPGSFRDIANFGNKIKRPFETVVSGLRAINWQYVFRRTMDNESPSSARFMDRFKRTGERPFDWRAPNGFPDNSQDWLGSHALPHPRRAVQRGTQDNT